MKVNVGILNADLTKAATRIQATFRGHMSRKVDQVAGEAKDLVEKAGEKIEEKVSLELGGELLFYISFRGRYWGQQREQFRYCGPSEGEAGCTRLAHIKFIEINLATRGLDYFGVCYFG